MEPIRLGGLASGLDTAAIVEAVDLSDFGLSVPLDTINAKRALARYRAASGGKITRETG